MLKNLYVLTINFDQNYFDGSTKLFLVFSKILELSAKSFFSCKEYTSVKLSVTCKTETQLLQQRSKY